MSEPILEVTDVGKSFRSYASQWSRVAGWLAGRPRGYQEHWRLRNVSFIANRGESIGILGRNGAGKSTLLKIIAGTLTPTEGHVQVEGRINAILELGMGFNAEFSGRQNTYHSLGLLGFSRTEIDAMIPEIESFAEIGEYFDLPVRTYSTGMHARLTFSIATHVRPEILIVDEVLAVGDAAFQRKCLRRIEEFVQQGTLLLYVSHDTESVKKICDSALLLWNGEQAVFGNAKSVCDEYEKRLFGANKKNAKPNDVSARLEGYLDPELTNSCEIAYGDGRAVIEEIWLEDEDNHRINTFRSGGTLKVRYRVRFSEKVEAPLFAIMIKTREGLCVYGSDSELLAKETESFESGDRADVHLELRNALSPGVYYLNCGVKDSKDRGVFLHRRVDTLIFKVLPRNGYTDCIGISDMQATLSVKRHSPDETAAPAGIFQGDICREI